MLKVRRRIRLLSILSGVLLALLSSCSGGRLDPDQMIGEQAPALTGTDLTGAGITDLSALSGKPTAVVFWLNTCPHCQTNLPEIQEIWPDLASDYNILTVGMLNPDAEGGPGYETPEDFVATTGLTLPSIEYSWEQAHVDWKVGGVPTVFVLNDQQQIEDVLTGDDLVDRLQQSLVNVDLKCCGT